MHAGIEVTYFDLLAYFFESFVHERRIPLSDFFCERVLDTECFTPDSSTKSLVAKLALRKLNGLFGGLGTNTMRQMLQVCQCSLFYRLEVS